MRMARPAKNPGFKYRKGRIAERKKTEMARRGTENHPGFNAAGPRQMRQTRVIA
jgi:hypothetical protein